MKKPKDLKLKDGGMVYLCDEDPLFGERFGVSFNGFELADSASLRKLINFLNEALVWVEFSEKERSKKG